MKFQSVSPQSTENNKLKINNKNSIKNIEITNNNNYIIPLFRIIENIFNYSY